MQSRSDRNYRGIDISNNNGHVNLGKVRNSGVKVVYFKASEGDYFKDSYARENYNNAKANGLLVGAYHYFRPSKDPIAQANVFYSVIKGMNLDCKLALDVEVADGFGKTTITTRCLQFINEIQRLTGMEVVIYSYTSFIQTSLDSRLSKYSLWVAQYGPSKPSNNGLWNIWAGFQYSEHGIVPGVNGKCDLNEFTSEILNDGKGVSDSFNSIALEQCNIVDSNENIIGTIFKHERVELRWITSDYRKYIRYMTNNGFKEGLVESGKTSSVIKFDDAYTHFNNSGKTVDVVDGNGKVTGAIYANEKVMRAWIDTDGNAYIVYDNANGEKLIKAGNVPAAVLEDVSKMPKPNPDIHEDITYNAIATEECNVEDSAGNVIGCVYRHERFQIKWVDSDYRKYIKYNVAGGYKEGYIEKAKTGSAIYIKDAYTHYNKTDANVGVIDGNGMNTGAIYPNEKVRVAWWDGKGNAYIVYDNANGERLIKSGYVSASTLEVIPPPDPDEHDDITFNYIALEAANTVDADQKVIGSIDRHERVQLKWVTDDYTKYIRYVIANGYKEAYVEKAKNDKVIAIKDAYTHYNKETSNVDVKDSNGSVVGYIYPNEKVMRAWIDTNGNAYILFDNSKGERLIKAGYVSNSVLEEIGQGQDKPKDEIKYNAIAKEACNIVDSDDKVIGSIEQFERVEIKTISEDYRKYIKYNTVNGYKEGFIEKDKTDKVLEFDLAYTHYNKVDANIGVMDDKGTIIAYLTENEKVMISSVDEDGIATIVYDDALGDKLIHIGKVEFKDLCRIGEVPSTKTYEIVATKEIEVKEDAEKELETIKKGGYRAVIIEIE